jgi:hypothetical protein
VLWVVIRIGVSASRKFSGIHSSGPTPTNTRGSKITKNSILYLLFSQVKSPCLVLPVLWQFEISAAHGNSCIA